MRAIRRGHPALSGGRHEGLAAEGDLLVFARRDTVSGDVVVVAVNRGAAPAAATFATPAEWGVAARATDLWNRAGFEAADGKLSLTVESKSARILAKE